MTDDIHDTDGTDSEQTARSNDDGGSSGPIRTAIDDASRRDFMKAAAAGSAITAGFASGVISSAVAVGIPTPWLERDGNLLRDPDGNQVILRGVNIADPARLARNWRGKDTLDVYDKVTDTNESNDGGWHNHVLRVPTQPQDISGANNSLQHAHGDDWGPLLPGQFTESDLEAYFSSYVDPIVDQAEEDGVYVMIDYHRHFPIFHQPQNEADIGEYQCGNESFPNDRGFCGERGVLWHSEDQASQLDGYTEEYAAELDQELQLYWNFVAPRYNDRSHVLYDIYNEPTGPYAGDWGTPNQEPHAGEDAGQDAAYDAQANKEYWDMWVDRAQPWVDTVREQAPDNLITVGSPRWSQLTYWAPTNEFDGENICYTGHAYTHDSLRPLSDSFGTPAEDVPLFFSEFGWAEGGGKDDFSFLEGTASEYADEFETFIEDHPIHPICWNFDHTWEPAFFVHDQSQDGNWVLHDYESRPGQWWQEFLYEHRNDDLPSDGSGTGGSGTGGSGSGTGGTGSGGSGTGGSGSGTGGSGTSGSGSGTGGSGSGSGSGTSGSGGTSGSSGSGGSSGSTGSGSDDSGWWGSGSDSDDSGTGWWGSGGDSDDDSGSGWW